MRVLFIGSVVFSAEMLKTLIEIEEIEICGVITKQSSNFNTDFFDLSSICVKYNLDYKFVQNINNADSISWMKEKKPDVMYCFGWSSLIKLDVLKIAKLGVIGYHPSALPFNKGRHPIIWALVLGLESTASTFFRMDLGADTGDLLSQEIVLVDHADYAIDLYNKLIEVAKKQVVNFTKQLKENKATFKSQSRSDGNHWRKRSRIDGKIDFRMNSKNIYNLIRALAPPYPCAEFSYNSQTFKVWKSEIGNNVNKNIEPGKVLNVMNREIEIKTGDNSIILIENDLVSLPNVGEYLYNL